MNRDWFAEAFGGAVSDIRQKLVDEAWFGRRHGGAARSDPPSPSAWHDLWGSTQSPGDERADRDDREPGHGQAHELDR